MAAWWRPTAANYFDRVSKAVILEALTDVGGPTLASRFLASKKGELAASAERIFAGNFITEVEVKDRALAWLPAAMRFADMSDAIPAGEMNAHETGDAVADTQSDATGNSQPEAGADFEPTAWPRGRGFELFDHLRIPHKNAVEKDDFNVDAGGHLDSGLILFGAFDEIFAHRVGGIACTLAEPAAQNVAA
jgi:hypothetical protein